MEPSMPKNKKNTKRREETTEAIKFVLFSARENDVRFIRLWFTDILGTLKGFAITVDELEGVLNDGASFDGSSIEGLARYDEADMVAVPDPTTWQILPWRPRENAVARMFCDIQATDGSPNVTDNRQVLRNNLKRASELGLTFYVAPEIEYYYLDGEENLEPHDTAGYFDQTSDTAGADLRRRTVLALEDMGIPVKHSHHEVSPGQHEIDLRHTNALTMADSVITFRVIVKEIASQTGGTITFMPRPFNDRNGSGMHTHMSLFRGDENAFFSPNVPMNLSDMGKHFIAGLLKHAPEITAITNQWVNSYKRLVPGVEAPVYAAFTVGNLGDLIRIPAMRSGRSDSARMEYRAPDSATNPYLCFSALLAAGLAGIKGKYELPSPISGNVFDMSPVERAEHDILELPKSLNDALKLARNSELLDDALGTDVLESFLKNKHIEWEQYARTVTDYEVKRYLTLL